MPGFAPQTAMSRPQLLFIFLDGVGLGPADPELNPFVTAAIPHLMGLMNGQRPVAGVPVSDGGRALFIPTDACLGVSGAPQSATGQGAIVTGLNVPQLVGEHWGPSPNAPVADIIRRESLFVKLRARGVDAALLNAYPQRYFDAIRSGRRIFSAIPLAVTAAGISLLTADDLRAGQALSADLTGEGWRTDLGVTDAPLYSPMEAGHKLAELAGQRPFSFFEYWLTDYAGHRGTLAEARQMIEKVDAMLGGLLEAWDDRAGLVVITSDHGNLETLTHRHHTRNPVPTFIIGAERAAFAQGLSDLTHFAPAILKYLTLA
jgi:2,3-bisphosphoglycerate-independent phosphoglycerate mutase